MSISILIKMRIANILNNIGYVSWKLSKHSRNDLIILTYHRVINPFEAEKGLEPGMYVEPKTFEFHVGFLIKSFKIVPLRGILEELSGTSDVSDDRPSCVLTFDDGWCDFYTNIYPVLIKYNIPATVFLPTDFIGTEKRFWTERLATILYNKKGSSFQKHNSTKPNSILIDLIENQRGNIESCIEKAVNLLKCCRMEEVEDIISEISKRWQLESLIPGRAFLSWDEIIEMTNSGLVSFGSHTVSHRILTNLDDKEVWYELVRSRDKLIEKGVVDSSFIAFCYPNGDYNHKIVKLVKEAGYHLAVTTKNGWNKAGCEVFSLNRVNVHQDMTSTDGMLGCRILGII